MKILFVIPTLGSGGAERALVQLVNHYGIDDEITVMSLFKVGNHILNLNPNVQYKYVFSKMFRGNIHFFKAFNPTFLFERMIKEKYDMIVSYLEGPTTRIVSGCKDGTRIVNWIHTSPTDESVMLKSYRNRKEFIECMCKYTNTVFVAESARKRFFAIFPELSGMESSVIYNPINNTDILVKAKEQTEVQLSLTEFNIVAIGRLSKVKGFERLINICVELREAFNIHLYILGKGDEEEKLRRLIKEHYADEYITMLGFYENPYPIIKQASLYVCSSYREGYSTSVIESLILGIPVVTTMCSGMEEILGSKNEYGLITENTDEALCDGIRRILVEDELYKMYKVAARKRGEFFELSKGVESVRSLLQKYCLERENNE